MKRTMVETNEESTPGNLLMLQHDAQEETTCQQSQGLPFGAGYQQQLSKHVISYDFLVAADLPAICVLTFWWFSVENPT